jgi:peptidoglycan/xylan/chitin deacetylase (PgdA/CDA1 family)
MESIYEYGARAGFWRLHRMLGDLPVTVYGVATALARAPEQVAAMKDAGWEIASHGLKWIEYKDFSEAEERAHMAEAIRAAHGGRRRRPRGWYTGRTSMNTVRLAAEEGGFAYVADSYADDLPYWLRFGERDQLIVPYTLDANDMRFATPQGFNSGYAVRGLPEGQFRRPLCGGARGRTQDAVDRPALPPCRAPGPGAALKRALDYMRAHDGVWFATRLEIAEHWAATHPPATAARPSEMDRDTFVDGLRRHLRAFALDRRARPRAGTGPAHDTARGVHSALARIFRSASEEERLGVLTAHPDLAGKLAAAKRLTAESTSEQASAGLDALTDAERAPSPTSTPPTPRNSASLHHRRARPRQGGHPRRLRTSHRQ